MAAARTVKPAAIGGLTVATNATDANVAAQGGNTFQMNNVSIV
jgi:hypothetical protein